jgi:hypothetical protein
MSPEVNLSALKEILNSQKSLEKLLEESVQELNEVTHLDFPGNKSNLKRIFSKMISQRVDLEYFCVYLDRSEIDKNLAEKYKKLYQKAIQNKLFEFVGAETKAKKLKDSVPYIILAGLAFYQVLEKNDTDSMYAAFPVLIAYLSVGLMMGRVMFSPQVKKQFSAKQK